MLRITRTQGVSRDVKTNVGRLTSGGRINGMCWRWNAESGEGLEMYSAHGDGRICCWKPMARKEEETEEEESQKRGKRKVGDTAGKNDDDDDDDGEEEEEKRRQKKRKMLGDLVEGLTKQKVRLS